jgi:hypothetical protein
MRLRIGFIVLSVTLCLCSALIHIAIPRQVTATDKLKQGRHSLIIRPSGAWAAPAALNAAPKVPQRVTAPSLVVPLYPARDRAGSLSSIASAAANPAR